MIKRYNYTIKGTVQGVGFRPFIYKLALKYSLIGFINNNNIGVNIEIEGDTKDLKNFEKDLKSKLPPLALISSLKKEEITPLYKGQFEIVHSEFQSSLVSLKTASVPPDMAICNNCLLDIKSSKTYQDYFATNCTNCGPRYSIIQTVPYDRENTSMKDFKLCTACQKEYKDPTNRRYHAQPTSCTECGLTLSLYSKLSKVKASQKDIINITANFIKLGMIGAIKGVGGFHIVCDASNDDVINKLRKFKNRPTKPFALMCKDVDMVKTIAKFDQKEKEILQSKEAPIVILEKNENSLDSIAPNITKIGCMVSYTGFYHLLFEYLNTPIVATSANISGDPIITTKQEIEEKLPFLDFIVDYDRDIVNAVDDSVVQIVNNDLQILRLSRGYTPKEIQLPLRTDKKILAVGANQKSTISLAFDDKIILSPYIADLNSINSVEYFKRTIDTFKRFYDFVPDIIVCDKHPNYETTLWTKEQNIDLVQLQHHLAHLYSVKAEHNLIKDYIGFIFDGTGFGDDGILWGGEVFVNDKRKYYFKPIKLLGGEKAIKQCKRVALSILFDNYSLDEVLKLDIPTIKAFTEVEIKMLYTMWQKNLNSPSSSSVGRLFDAIASFSGVCQTQSYEGEAGLLCEMKYDKNCFDSFQYTLENNIIDIEFDFFDKQIINKFLNTLVNIIIYLSKMENLPIILSGGVFQNKILLELIIKECKKLNIDYYYNQQIPINDSGISIGQIYNYLSNIK